MTSLDKLKSFLRHDPLIRRVLRNSGYLFSGNVASAVLNVVQGILVARLLGDAGLGLLTIIMDFASNTNRLLSFRMSEVVVKYMGEALTRDKKERAAALVKGLGLTEAFTSILAYLVLLALAPWGAQLFADNVMLADLFRFYGLFLLANLLYETSIGVLQTTDKFKQVAQFNFYQSIVITLLIVAAFMLNWGLTGILTAYLVGKAVTGVTVVRLALQEMNGRFGRGWIRVPLNLVSDWKSILSFAFNTNLNGTVNLFARDNIRLYLAIFLPDAQVGYFTQAARLINLMMLPVEPFIWPTYAEITRTIAQRQWQATRTLLKQVSAIAGSWTFLAGGGLALFGWWLIPFLYGADFAPAYPCLLILLIGYGVANVLNWNRPLLLALGHPNYPLVVAAVTGAIEIVLLFLFLPTGRYLIGAAIFSAYLAISILINVARGLSILNRNEMAAS
jgi:O-antigen/teichoic acid export membrane protein